MKCVLVSVDDAVVGVAYYAGDVPVLYMPGEPQDGLFMVSRVLAGIPKPRRFIQTDRRHECGGRIFQEVPMP